MTKKAGSRSELNSHQLAFRLPGTRNSYLTDGLGKGGERVVVTHFKNESLLKQPLLGCTFRSSEAGAHNDQSINLSLSQRATTFRPAHTRPEELASLHHSGPRS